MKVDILVPGHGRESAVRTLNALLIDEYRLFVRAREYCIDARRTRTPGLARFFESQYRDLEEMVNEVAERACSACGTAIDTLTWLMREPRPERGEGNGVPSVWRMASALLAENEAIIRSLRIDWACQDGEMKGFLAGLLENHQNAARALRAFSEG